MDISNAPDDRIYMYTPVLFSELKDYSRRTRTRRLISLQVHNCDEVSRVGTG